MAASAPDDIVLLILGHLVCAEDAEEHWPVMRYDHRAAQAPFTAAAVCQHWRRLAVSTSTLWTYFGFPCASEMSDRHLQRLELLQRRAGAAPIDVVFGWITKRDEKTFRRDAVRSVFDSIIGLHLQWRNVVLQVAGTTRSGWTADPLPRSAEWPLLESLSLSMDEVSSALPAAPRLRRVWLDCASDSVGEPFSIRGHPNLAMLGIWGSMSTIRALTQILGNQLIELTIANDVRPKDDSNYIVFRMLQHLVIDDNRWLRYLDAPVLKKLSLTSRYIKYMDSQTICRFKHIQELQFCGRKFDADTLAILSSLSGITTLTFRRSQFLVAIFGQTHGFYQIETGALRELVNLNRPIWPHLQRLHFASFGVQKRSDWSVVDAQDLVNFVSSRNAKTANPSPGLPATARIVEVVVEYPGAPDWLEDTLRVLTAN